MSSRSASSQRILITGASRGIGAAAALQLARLGHRVVLAARTRGELERVAAQIAGGGGQAEVLVMDVTDDTSVETAIAQLEADGPCDVLVNNAGTCDQAEFLLQRPAARRAEMELNYWGPQRVTRALLPGMLRRGHGTIVNVSSLIGYVGCPTTANYSATKAALNAWSHALRGEVARFGVQVRVFVAAHTQTDLARSTRFDGVHSLPVEYTARELVAAIERDHRERGTGPVYRFLLWLARMLPEFMEARIAASTRALLLPREQLLESAPLRAGAAAAPRALARWR
jgi:short-subunit dehydrogenase